MENQRSNNQYIFISYAHDDGKKVVPIIEKLRQMGYRVWIDNREHLSPGSFWSSDIKNAVDHAHVFLAFFSKSYFKSDYCKYELQEAINNNQLIQTVYLDDVKLPRSYAACDRTQNLYLGECRTLNEFYGYLFNMQGLAECRLFTGANGSTSVSVGTGEQLTHSIRSFHHRNKKTFIKIVAAGMVLLLAIGACAWKGPAVVSKVQQVVNDKLDRNQETLTQEYIEEEESLDLKEVSPAVSKTSSFTSGNKDTAKQYQITFNAAGNYYLIPTNLPNYTSINIVVTDSDDSVVAEGRCSNNEGLLLENLQESVQYKFQLISSDPLNVTLDLWAEKKVKDLSEFAGVKDSLQYKEQNNKYDYTAPLDGDYCFTFDELSNGAKATMNVYDKNHNLIYDHRFTNKEGTVINFEKGATYQIEIGSYEGLSDYELHIDRPVESRNITSCKKVNGKTSFEGQKISYHFLAEKTGRYHFSFTDINTDDSMLLQICDENDNIFVEEKVKAGQNVFAAMEEGMNYHIYVYSQEGSGEYVLNLVEPNKSKSIGTGKYKGTMTVDYQFDTYQLKAKPGYVYTVNIERISDNDAWDSMRVNVYGKNLDESGDANDPISFTVEEKEVVSISIEQGERLKGTPNEYEFIVKKEKIR